MRINDLKDEYIKEFCGMDGASDLLEAYKTAAKSFILGFTGLKVEELDKYEDLTFAYLVLINDMSLNRDYVVSKENINPTVSAILSLYSRNQITG